MGHLGGGGGRSPLASLRTALWSRHSAATRKRCACKQTMTSEFAERRRATGAVIGRRRDRDFPPKLTDATETQKRSEEQSISVRWWSEIPENIAAMRTGSCRLDFFV